MKTNCTKCNKEWVVSKYINPEDYECPHCYSERKKDERIRKIRKSIEKYITS